MKVNGIPIPNARFEMEWQRLNEAKQQDPQLASMPDDQLRHKTQENVIGQTLLEEHARKVSPKIPAKLVDDQLKAMIKEAGNEKRFLRKFDVKKSQLKEFRAHIEHTIRMQRFMTSLTADVQEPTDADVEEFYRKNPLQFGQPETVRASHIVKHTNDGTPKEDALRIVKQAQRQLEEGAEFGLLCRQYSDCKGQGGDLGWFSRGHMVQRFEDVIFDMEPGDVSDVFETEFGFHIAMLHEKKPAEIKPLEEVKDGLKRELWDQRRHAVIEELVDTLRAKAKVEQ